MLVIDFSSGECINKPSQEPPWIQVEFLFRSGLKTPSKAQWLCCPAKRDSRHSYYTMVHHRPPINAHIPMYAENNDFLDRPAPWP
jgi:hypothetical protein